MRHAPNCMIGRMEWQNTRMHEMGCTCGAALRDTPERSGTAGEAPSSEGPQGAARSPMTGDGAVVREWEVMRRLAEAILHNREASFADWLDLARAYLAQAAEIERLTAILEAEQSLGKELSELAQEHAEARTADLLKALERYGHHMVDCKSQRAASRTSASCGPCTCGLAAAKGETV